MLMGVVGLGPGRTGYYCNKNKKEKGQDQGRNLNHDKPRNDFSDSETLVIQNFSDSGITVISGEK
jgi:hypothetical protein